MNPLLPMLPTKSNEHAMATWISRGSLSFCRQRNYKRSEISRQCITCLTRLTKRQAQKNRSVEEIQEYRMLRLGFVLFLCVYGALAYRIDYELEDMHSLWARQTPTVCKKDIWILWDNSQSVGWKYFDESIRPFVKKLITSPQLNVGPEGTHIGIITFSIEKKTKVWLKIGDKNQEELLEFLDGYKRSDFEKELMGEGTRTGMAFKLADEILSKNNPANHREEVGDVVLLFTDGQPKRLTGEDKFGDQYIGKYGERRLANDRSGNLKARDITVVGLGIGTEGQLKQFREYIKQWVTTPWEKYYFEAELGELPESNLTRLIIGPLCIDPGNECGCDLIGQAPSYTAHGETASIRWLKPTLKCASGIDPSIQSTDVEPSVSSPAKFGVGHHTITYTFGYLRGPKTVKKKCFVEIDVKNCECPSSAPVQAELQPGQNEASVSWKVPEPNCPATLKSVSRPGAESGQDSFPIGDYTITYNYEHSSHTGSFSLSCPVSISVQGTLCGGIAFDQSIQICCCGKIYDRKANHKCCGYQYYDTGAQTCEEQFTLVDRN